MLEDLDFRILDDPNFKEDSVREEIISPILKSVGYRVTGPMKIVRSKTLPHPFVHIGSQKRKINIIPDYVLYLDEYPIFVLEAKSPSEDLINSSHAEQAFSYAIHPDIRSDNYGLCNGRLMVIYNVKEVDPLIIIDIEQNKNNLDIFNQYLHPDYIRMPEKREFWKDFGTRAKKAGFTQEQDFIFVEYFLQDIIKVEDDLYTASAGHDEPDGNKLFVSFDFNKQIFDELMSRLPEQFSNSICDALCRQPFRIEVDCKIILSCNSKLGEITQGSFEKFVPLVITEIIDVFFDPNSECGD